MYLFLRTVKSFSTFEFFATFLPWYFWSSTLVCRYFVCSLQKQRCAFLCCAQQGYDRVCVHLVVSNVGYFKGAWVCVEAFVWLFKSWRAALVAARLTSAEDVEKLLGADYMRLFLIGAFFVWLQTRVIFRNLQEWWFLLSQSFSFLEERLCSKSYLDASLVATKHPFFVTFWNVSICSFHLAFRNRKLMFTWLTMT